MHKTVTLTIDGPIARVCFNRPEAMNGLNAELPVDLCEAMQAAADNDDVRVVVFEGNGKCFMAGGDIQHFDNLIKRAESNNVPVMEEAFFDYVHGAVKIMRAMPKPIIAKVHGAVAGIGVSYMAACDLVVAEQNTVFTLAYRNIGITPDGGSTWTLPRSIGFRKTMELALLGDRFGASEAVEMGLINEAVSADELDTRVEALCKKLLQGPTHVQARIKHMLNQSMHNDLEEQLALEAYNFVTATHKPEFKEGITAFLEKRKPDFAALDSKPSEFYQD